ncbi:RAMP superfamily CRISPR-associated protein [Halalkalibacterium halodurans]|uniref:RAMP superfamily CRISPR-associated protein n=1 Tax=Halalkalibacterium halodurans TaxID=86665 RepID=UPI002E2054BB|nr:RAMP superfamily CRISPR-associated protein [Halalkalibacterium halodurans]
MKKYLVIEINNKEPLKIGSGGSKAQTEPAKEYIPGSTIRGAVIAQLLRNGIYDESTIKEALQKIQCYNAYPYRAGKLFIPTPQHLRMSKHEWRKKKVSNEKDHPCTLNLINLLEDQRPEMKNPLEYRFVAVHDRRLTGVKIPKTYRQHHTKGKEKDNLFSYEAISPNQTFRAIIAFDESITENVLSLKKTNVWYLGGSKGSGYGRCELKVIGGSFTSFDQAKEKLGLSYEYSTNHQELTVTFLSDCILRNEQGQPINAIPTSDLEKICGQRVELENHYIQTGLSEGYNAKWRARYPKETTIRAGSVLKYHFSDELSVEKWKQLKDVLENHLIGSRTQDGYGWLAVNIDFPTCLEVREAKHENTRKNVSPDIPALQEIENDDAFKVIQKGLQQTKQRWLNLIYKRSSDSGQGKQDEGKQIIMNLSKSAHYQNLLNILDRLEEELGKGTTFKGLLRDYALDNRKCSIVGQNFEEILKFVTTKDPSTTKFESLNAYSAKMLSTRKGQLYYSDHLKNPKQLASSNQRFIFDLLKASLEIGKLESKSLEVKA